MLASLSFANLCTGLVWTDLLYRDMHGYFHELPVTRIQLIAWLVNMAVITLGGYFVLSTFRRLQRAWLQITVALALLMAFVLPLEFMRIAVFGLSEQRFVTLLHNPLTIGLLLLSLAGTVWRPDAMVRVLRRLLATVSLLCAVSIGKALLLLLGVLPLGPADPPKHLAAPLAARTDAPRVIWLIFDELDYRVVFPERPTGVKLPEFDRLLQESLTATQAQRPGGATAVSLPTLISGERVIKASPVGRSELLVTLADGRTTNWSALPSVFARARTEGFNSGLVGWYHPYRRIFAPELLDCDELNFPVYAGSGSTLSRAFVRQLASAIPMINLRRQYIELHHRSRVSSLSMATNDVFALTFLHLAMPHTPGVYRGSDNQFTVFGMNKIAGYFNALVLADRTLGEIRRALDQQGLSARTWLIVSTDHNWRDSNVYDGKLDERVPFIIKPPVASRGQVFDKPINTRVSAELALAILKGEVRNGDDLAPWLTTHAPAWDPPAAESAAETE